MNPTRPSIVNVINFIRGVEPREHVDLYEPVHEQLKLLAEHNLTGTFLLQYDALIDTKFVDMLRSTPHEIGAWIEIVQPLCEAAGIAWRGRFPWDWHSHVGFTVGYTPAERELLIDKYMEMFHATFDYYPKSAGSWLIDAHTLQYLSTKYGVIASCNCKDQWGTDGYTLWGGYYGQAYYPSKGNAYAPAQSVENQIDIPIFKMLGSDPVYQYDAGLSLEDGAAGWQHVITLEPVYVKGGGGGNAVWTDWFFENVMSNSACLTFRYAQAGQENSFGWRAMESGLRYQFELMSKMCAEGTLLVEPLAKSAENFRKFYPVTPNSAITALSDWKSEERKSIWFNSCRYRANLYGHGSKFWFRDITLFDDGYTERYLNTTCQSHEMTYDNLPIIDGNRWSGSGIRAGGYLMSGDNEVEVTDTSVIEDNTDLVVTLTTQSGNITIRFSNKSIKITTDIADFSIQLRWGKSVELDTMKIEEKRLKLTHEGFDYSLLLSCGLFDSARKQILCENGEIVIEFEAAV